MKVTRYGPNGLPLPLAGWSSGYVSIGSNTDTNPSLSSLNFVQRITANTSNTLLNPIVNFASGSNIILTLDQGPFPTQAYPSNTIRIHSTGGVGGTISAGSNSTRISEDSSAGASTTLWSPFDHRHDGIGTITASSSNTMQRGTFNLRSGNNVSFGLTDSDGDGELDTMTIHSSASGGGGTPGASGALVFLESHTASSSAQLDFTTFISSTYDTYQFEFIDIVPATNAAHLWLRAGTGGGPTYDTGSNYEFMGQYMSTSGTGTSGSTSSTAVVVDNNALGINNGASDSPFNGWIKLYDPQSTSYYKAVQGIVNYRETTASLFVTNTFWGRYKSTTALTAVRFLMSSGNITSGTIRVYGMTKS